MFRYNNRRIDDFHTARLIAFDLFDEQHESRGEVQPYWMVCGGFITKAVR